MKVQNVNRYHINLPDDVVAHMEKAQTMELLMEAMMSELVKDKWYAIRLSEHDDPLYEEGCIQKRMAVEFKPCQEQTIVYRPPEQMFLTPTKGIKQKLKNCIRYMRDKSGGTFETKETHNG